MSQTLLAAKSELHTKIIEIIRRDFFELIGEIIIYTGYLNSPDSDDEPNLGFYLQHEDQQEIPAELISKIPEKVHNFDVKEISPKDITKYNIKNNKT